MHDIVVWATGRASIENTSVGPRHDPYIRTIVDLDVRNREFVLYSCALAGDWIEEVVEGKRKKLAEIRICATGEERREFCKKVELLTGYEPDFWLDDMWERVREHRPDNYYDFDGIYT